ncbi:hypothetical protein MBLNU457_1637t2 [Dothideomycetes sp. NU457]
MSQPATPTPSPYLTTPTPTHLTTLTHLSTLLHLLHHRNKNQHRLATWYRHFSTLRRHISRLLTHYTTLLTIPETYAARHRKKTADITTRSQITSELDFWTEVLVAKWCRAFSQLAADLRFGVLGVFLLAVVGEVAATTGVTAVLEERGEREVVCAIERFGREFKEDEDVGDGNRGKWSGIGEDVGEVMRREARGGDGGEDQGEVVEREPMTDPQKIGVDEAENVDADEFVESDRVVPELLEDDEPVPAITKKRPRPVEAIKSKDEQVKRKKKRKNAIDELFGSL